MPIKLKTSQSQFSLLRFCQIPIRILPDHIVLYQVHNYLQADNLNQDHKKSEASPLDLPHISYLKLAQPIQTSLI